MKLFLILLTLLVVLFTPKAISAHLAGQPPYFKINGVYSNLYPVPTTSLNNFNLPQDLAAENYLVNQNLTFEFDINALPAPKEIILKTKFFWDFGDRTKAEGLKNVHSYSKEGSFILAILAQAPGDSSPQLLQSVMLNILPDKNYKLPKSKIKINGQTVKDPLIDVIKVKFDSQLSLDGSDSTGGSAQIASYFWDLGDQKTSSEKTLTRTYSKDLSQLFPVLRIQNSDGFIADSFVEIENTDFFDTLLTASASSTPTPKPKDNQTSNLFVPLTGIILIGGVIFIIFRKRKLK
ncbi:PKD domain-containing protein [Candidatus Daviesbacteria bacterium]|nr:PKD domain-containing protein [Candidatus Daviesbacteria bacterium]